MKLLIRQYVASLRERGELDAILPDLLCELGYNVISRPSIGTRQYGVDIAAVGIDDDGDRKLFLLSVKQGDLLRADWEGAPQALRPSLDEIRQIYLRIRVPKEYQQLKVVICLCFGGDVHESVQDNVTGYIEEHSNDRISFKQWNGDVIAGLLIKGILKENLLAVDLRSSFQKSVAMVDEPAICFQHFSHLARQLCDSKASTVKSRITIIRQLYLCLWVMFVWARDADNVEGPYLASELLILQGWRLLRNDLGKASKASRDAGVAFNELVDLHFTIFDELVDTKILPHADKLHVVSMAVDSPSPVDVNGKMFDLLGRIALHGLWRMWLSSGGAPLPSVKAEWNDERLQELTQKLVLLIRNNPTLLSPMQDVQSVEVTLGLMLFTMQEDFTPAAASWIEALIESFIFAYRTHGRYPTIKQDYRDLLSHPNEATDEYRKEHTAASTLVPLLGLWAQGIKPDQVRRLTEFTAKDLEHCNFQLWLADEDSEGSLYTGDDQHGAMITSLPITNDIAGAFSFLETECDETLHFQQLSAMDMGHWPIILLACRHYRLPIPPNLWLNLVRPKPTSEQSCT